MINMIMMMRDGWITFLQMKNSLLSSDFGVLLVSRISDENFASFFAYCNTAGTLIDPVQFT